VTDNIPCLINGKAIDRVSDDDRAWFSKNPGCRFRLREMVKVEFNNWPIGEPGDGFVWRVLVASIAKGVRFRTAVSLLESMTSEAVHELGEEMSQVILAQLFDQVAPEWLRKGMASERGG
jgi:hypothetical protein